MLQHPLQEAFGLNEKPVEHEKLNTWRENFEGVQYFHPETGMIISGAIDDLWQNDQGEYVVVDYKATAKSEPVVSLDEEWQDTYKKQMEVYQWLLRRNGLKVSNTGYFVYCTGKPDEESFDGKLEFDISIIPYQGDDSWVEPVIKQIKETLEKDEIPSADPKCDYCRYREVLKKAEGC